MSTMRQVSQRGGDKNYKLWLKLEVYAMDRISVTSSDLASVGYELNTATLEVEFHSGGIYQYFGVPANVYEELITAGSKGVYFNQNVKMAGYSYSKVG